MYVLLLPASKLAENGFRVTVTNYNKENVSQIATYTCSCPKNSYHFFYFVTCISFYSYYSSQKHRKGYLKLLCYS